MGLFDFFKSKKKTAEEDSPAPAAELVSLAGAELTEPEPPETRYTQEYQDYLAAQEAGDTPAEEE